MSYFLFYVRVKERVERNKYSLFSCNYVEKFPLPLGAWDGLPFLFWHSLGLPYTYFTLEA